MSKLDRFFVSNNILDSIEHLKGIVLPRGRSDHAPLLLYKEKVDFGTTAFKLFSSWLARPGFDNVVKETWVNIVPDGSDNSIMAKLKVLKSKLKVWNKDLLYSDASRIQQIMLLIVVLDSKIDDTSITESDLQERVNLLKEVDELKSLKDQDLLQKSRINWDIEGDENSKFFHCSLKSRRAQQAIQGRSQLLSIAPEAILSFDDASSIDRDVMNEEIKDAVWDCGSSKSPGPDGFSFLFIKAYWDLLQHDICSTVRDFFHTAKMPTGANSAFVSLIPKVSNPVLINDFRPISLIGVILDGPLILSAVISWYKKRNQQMLLFKVDFEKAYDSVNWEYLNFMLSSLGFSNKWCRWINGCLNSARSSILINGSPTKEFPIKRGLRQGDPLSPFLFIIVMEGLHLAFNKAVSSNLIHGINIGGNIALSHLIYADDVIIMSRWSRDDLENIINVAKSNVFGVGVPNEDVTNLASITGCQVGSFPMTYLGVTVGANMKLVNHWQYIVSRFRMKLSSWKANLLSIGGRSTIVKSVLGSLAIYPMSIFKCLDTVVKLLESLRAQFFWGGHGDTRKILWLKWDCVLSSYDKGGLNIGSIKAFNLSLLQFINGVGDIITTTGRFGRKSSKLSMVRDGLIPPDALRLVVGNGSRVRFWLDHWIGNATLASRYSKLFHLESNKEVKVADRLVDNVWKWEWNRDVIGSRNDTSLEILIDKVVLPSIEPSTIWFKSLPRKLNIFLWRLRLDRLPHRINLAIKGISLPSVVCPRCNQSGEDAEHIFFECASSSDLWRLLRLWLSCNMPIFGSWNDFYSWFNGWSSNADSKLKVMVSVVTLLWIIWWYRNCVVFNDTSVNRSNLFDFIRLYSFNWLKSRSKLVSNWNSWLLSPL
ncbi:uncharacterized protein [Rutidosis leptorrhynchoides]|uniref:uncharacterized protein n=1 Tax=Rutidosis leptorrhynchoides TaxID=125765 RepID=UPI003A9988A5